MADGFRMDSGLRLEEDPVAKMAGKALRLHYPTTGARPTSLPIMPSVTIPSCQSETSGAKAKQKNRKCNNIHQFDLPRWPDSFAMSHLRLFHIVSSFPG